MPTDLAVALDAVIVAVSEEEPRVLVRLPDEALPAGPFDPQADLTLDAGLRRWVTEQTQLELGHVEQLYTFGDLERDPRHPRGPRMLSVAYLAFVRERTIRTPTATTIAVRSSIRSLRICARFGGAREGTIRRSCG